MFRILLINPPRYSLVRLGTPKIVDLGEISSFPPIGLMYLGQALREKNSEFKVEILDSVAYKLSYRQMIGKIKKFSPDIVGITATTYTFYDVWKTAKKIKELLPRIPIVVGGAHMYIFAKETMSHTCFDYGVVGDGEEVLSDLCERLYKRKKIIPIDGLFFRKGKKLKGRGSAELRDLDSVSFPAVDLINPFSYYSTLGKGRAIGTICTSRGCPFKCTFCQVPRVRYRMRSIENVLKEIQIYRDKGINDFFFFDDLFNLTKERVIDFCQELLSRHLKISWMFRGRADQINNKMLNLARQAGCHTVSLGVEDATDSGLKAIKKNITIKQAFEAVKLIRKNRLVSSTNWILGLPLHRNLSDLHYLLNTALEIDSDYAQFSILQCLPGSELFDQAVRERGIKRNYWKNYVLNPLSAFEPPIWEKYLTKKQLYDFYVIAYRKFYFRPKVIARELLRIRSFSEISVKLKALQHVFLK